MKFKYLMTLCLFSQASWAAQAQQSASTTSASDGYGGETWAMPGETRLALPPEIVVAGAFGKSDTERTSVVTQARLDAASESSEGEPSGPASVCETFKTPGVLAALGQEPSPDGSSLDVGHSGTGWLVGVVGASARAGPSQECVRIAALPRACEVVEIARHDGWLLVDILVAKRQVWVSAQEMRAATVGNSIAATDATRGRELWVDGINVLMRAGSGTNFTALASLPAGSRVREVGRNQHWLAVEELHTGRTGWVYEPLLSEHPNVERTPSAQPGPARAPPADQDEPWVVIERSADVRSAPEAGSPVLARLPRGTEVSAISVDREWLQVKAPGSGDVGWVHAAGLELARIVAAGATEFMERLESASGQPGDRTKAR